MKNGNEREVRWYTSNEYAKMYPGESVEPELFANQKNILGFQKGYITIFKGDQEAHEYWFSRSIARYCRHWGWYVVSEDVVPFDLPVGLEPIELKWEMVGNANTLKEEEEVRAAVDSLLYGAHPSTFQGNIGDRLDLVVTVIKLAQKDSQFGDKIRHNAIHTFEDAHGNYYLWDTGAKCWPEGEVKHIRGSVKEHKVINNVQTTVLTRCLEQMK
jgi:hypothetical protein